MWKCNDCEKYTPDEEMSRTWDGGYPEEERYVVTCPYCGSEDVEEVWDYDGGF